MPNIRLLNKCNSSMDAHAFSDLTPSLLQGQLYILNTIQPSNHTHLFWHNLYSNLSHLNITYFNCLFFLLCKVSLASYRKRDKMEYNILNLIKLN